MPKGMGYGNSSGNRRRSRRSGSGTQKQIGGAEAVKPSLVGLVRGLSQNARRRLRERYGRST